MGIERQGGEIRIPAFLIAFRPLVERLVWFGGIYRAREDEPPVIPAVVSHCLTREAFRWSDEELNRLGI